jgi:hypothetical protein
VKRPLSFHQGILLDIVDDEWLMDELLDDGTYPHLGILSPKRYAFLRRIDASS